MFQDAAAAFEVKHAVDLGIRRKTEGEKKVQEDSFTTIKTSAIHMFNL